MKDAKDTKQRASPVRVIITGPYDLLNAGLGSLLAELPGIEPAGVTRDLAAISETSLAQPQLVLLVVPRSDELARIPALRHRCPHVRVLCLALTWTIDQVLAAMNSGAIGCLSGDTSAGELAAYLRQAARGEVTLSPNLSRSLISRFLEDRPTAAHLHDSLTERELQVLELVCDVSSNKEIAQQLFLSVRTVENHLANIYAKLGVRSRTEAAVLALQQGWFGHPG